MPVTTWVALTVTRADQTPCCALWFRTATNRDVSAGRWATCSSVRSFPRIAHSLACSALLASLTRSAALNHSLRCIHSLTRSLTHSRAREKVNDKMSQIDLVLSHSAAVFRRPRDSMRAEAERKETTQTISAAYFGRREGAASSPSLASPRQNHPGNGRRSQADDLRGEVSLRSRF